MLSRLAPETAFVCWLVLLSLVFLLLNETNHRP